jgi:signal transduction histidine kinase
MAQEGSTVEPIAAQGQITLVLRQPQIENLLRNAMPHTLRKQRVWLQPSFPPGGWQVDVRDGGAAFPPKNLPKVFQRFSRTSRRWSG